MTEKYSFQDILNRYGMQRTTLSKFLVRHLSEINKGGIHAAKNGRSWEFDAVAIQIMDRLRGEFQPDIVSDSESKDSESIDRLKEQISNLQQLLLAAQKDALDAKNETIAALKERDKMKNELATISMRFVELQAKQDVSNRFDSKLEQMSNQNNEFNEHIATALSEIQNNVKQSHIVVIGKGWNKRGVTRKVTIHKV